MDKLPVYHTLVISRGGDLVRHEVNSEDEASGSKGNGPEQSSPCRKCAGEDKGEGEGDSGESGPLATSTLPWGDPAKARVMAQEFFDGIGPPGQPDQSSPSASGQPRTGTRKLLGFSSRRIMILTELRAGADRLIRSPGGLKG